MVVLLVMSIIFSSTSTTSVKAASKDKNLKNIIK